MKKYLLFCMLLWPLSVSAQTDDTEQTTALLEIPIRAERPHSITLGGLWPRGVGLEYQYQLSPKWGIGGHLGVPLLSITGGVFSRWYQSEEPATWYLEALLNSTLTGSAGIYSIQAPFVSINGLAGWEYRSKEGFTIRVGTGLGLSTFSTPGALSLGLMGQINLDAAIGYAF